MWAVRSASSSASLAWASPSHCASLRSRSFISAIGLLLSQFYSAGGAGGALGAEFPLRRCKHGLPLLVGALVELHGSELGQARVAEARGDVASGHARVAIPRLVDRHRGASSFLGAGLGKFLHHHRLFGDVG